MGPGFNQATVHNTEVVNLGYALGAHTVLREQSRQLHIEKAAAGRVNDPGVGGAPPLRTLAPFICRRSDAEEGWDWQFLAATKESLESVGLIGCHQRELVVKPHAAGFTGAEFSCFHASTPSQEVSGSYRPDLGLARPQRRPHHVQEGIGIAE